MKVVIYGATGKVGEHTVTAALEAGHEVTAVGRHTDAITRRHESLTVETGDVMSADDVGRLTPGHDVVITTFGAPIGKDTILHRPELCEVGTRNIVEAMTRTGVPRLICMTSIGAGDSHGHGRAIFAKIIEPLLLDRIMKDRNAQEDVVRRSTVDSWVIVRPAELSDDDTGEEVRVISDIEVDPEPSTVSRADVGSFLVSLVDDRSHDASAIVITN